MEAIMNPQKKPQGRVKFSYKKYHGKWEEFWGWKYAHGWMPGTDHLSRQINVLFYRAMWEVTPSAFTRTSHSTRQPLNWSLIEYIE
jgi:hypothetical protein